MKIDSLSNLKFQAVAQPQKVASSVFSFIKELYCVRNTPFPQLFSKKYFDITTPYPEELDNDAKITYPDLNIHAWRAEDINSNDISFIDYMIGMNKLNKKYDLSSQIVINKMKGNIDKLRSNSDSKISKCDFELNSIGFLERDSSKVVYRVDSRNPSELVDNNGFGPSLYVEGIFPMIDAPVLITSASLKGSNKVFHDWGFAKCSYQYAINSEGIKQASWADNFKFLNKIPDEHGEDFRLDYDESHIDENKSKPENIYIIDCSDETVKDRISTMYQTSLATSLGISLKDFIEHEKKHPHLNKLELNREFIASLD